ncbi:MAG: cell division protein FtsA [Candidatus Marinimicrobia bacterium]|nr:cell division protein FtsA [Candidatus Neomarinimicrobiota bacterium]
MIRSNLNSDKYIQAGLDIGSDKICCAISEIDLKSDTVKLLGLGNSQATSINRGAITHRDNLIDEIEHAIDEARTMSGVSIENLSLGISGEHIRGINTQGAIAIGGSQASNVSLQNEITKNDVKKVLDLAKAISLPMDRDILHVLPQEYVIDTMNSIKDPVGLTGRRLEAKVHVITVATTAATNLVSCVEELGIRVESIIYQGLASSLSTLNDDERKLGVVSVDIGASTTDIVIYYEEGIQHTATLGIGAASITNDIASLLQIGIDEAEKIKRQYASAKASMSSPDLEFELPGQNGNLKRKISENQLSQYVEARMYEILQLVMKEISRANLDDKLTFGMVITGGGSELKNLSSLAQEISNIKVRIGHPENISGSVEIASDPAFASAIGLTKWKFAEDDLIIKNEEITFSKAISKVKSLFKELF